MKMLRSPSEPPKGLACTQLVQSLIPTKFFFLKAPNNATRTVKFLLEFFESIILEVNIMYNYPYSVDLEKY